MEVNKSCTKRNRGTWWKNSFSVVGCISTGGGEEGRGRGKRTGVGKGEGEEEDKE
jgi:hypothetical protein